MSFDVNLSFGNAYTDSKLHRPQYDRAVSVNRSVWS